MQLRKRNGQGNSDQVSSLCDVPLPCHKKEIKITFNASFRLLRVPVAHTCGNILDLSKL